MWIKILGWALRHNEIKIFYYMIDVCVKYNSFLNDKKFFKM